MPKNWCAELMARTMAAKNSRPYVGMTMRFIIVGYLSRNVSFSLPRSHPLRTSAIMARATLAKM
jgi:hypothetical protein